MRIRIRRPRRKPTGTPRPKRTIVQAMKDAAKTLPKRLQTPPRNTLTGKVKKRKPTGTPRPRTTTPKPPETRQLADARRMSPNVDTRMKQLSIDRGRTKGVKSSVMDKSLGIDARMAALAKERRAKGQYKSRARVASDARKKALASAASRRVRGNTAKPNVTGIRRAMASYMRRRRKSRI